MLARIGKLFKSPSADSEEARLLKRNLTWILALGLTFTLLYMLYILITPASDRWLPPLVALVYEAAMLTLVRLGRARVAGFLFTFALWAAITYQMILVGGVRDLRFVFYILVIVLAEITLGVFWGGFFTFISILTGGVLIYAGTQGLLSPLRIASNFTIVFSYAITFLTALFMIGLISTNTSSMSRQILETKEKANSRINLLAQKETELTDRQRQVSKRDLILQAIKDVREITGNLKETDEGLAQVSQLLKDIFKYEIVDIYLVDETKERCILRSSKGVGNDQQYLEIFRGEDLYKGLGENYLSFQTDTDMVRIQSPASAVGMRINTSFPIKSGHTFLGILNIQSTSNDLEMVEQSGMTTIADQLALTLENQQLSNRLFSRQQEIEFLSGQTTLDSWKTIRSGKTIGYQYDRLQILPESEGLPKEIASRLQEGKPVAYITTGKKKVARLISPIMLRNQIIGIMGYEEDDPQYNWEEDRIIVLESVASQVGLALENTRLLSDARQRAQQEKIISEMTANIRETLDLDTVLHTALKEIRHSLGLEEVEIRLQPSSDDSRERSKEAAE